MFCAAHNQTFQVCLARFLVSRVKSEMLSREEFLMQPDSFGAGGYFNIQNKAFKHLYLHSYSFEKKYFYASIIKTSITVLTPA